MRSALNSSEEIEKFLGQYSHFGAPVKDLSRFSVLMNELGNPQDSLRYIHIVGTNGKGSTAEFCTSALAAAGFTVGRFTSPYVSSICERIAVAYPDGLYEISTGDFSRLLYTAADAAAKFPELEFSQFEIMNAAAFLYYAEKRVDYVVLEAGIGGTLDSTNIIRQPECAVVTSIGLDHTKILGDTVEKIARSKCGVIKGGNAVAGEDIPASAMEVIRERCTEVGARLIVPDSAELSVHSTGLEGSSFAYRGQEYRLRMGGEYQIRNAMTAIEVLLGMGISPAAIAVGLSRAQIPARMELFRSNSPGRPSVLLDGGHNPQAARAVRAALESSGLRHITGVIGMMNTKDYAEFLREILPCLERVIFCDGFSDSDVPAESLRAASGLPAEVFHDPAQALEYARSTPCDLVYCGGSFYFVAAIKNII